MANLRYNISPCSADETQAFISRIGAEYFLRSAVMADEKSHYDRYSYVRNESRVAVVYDTRAQVVSITAPEAYSEELLGVFGTDGKTVKRSTVPAQSGAQAQNQSRPTAEQRFAAPRNGGFNRSISVDTENGVRAKIFVDSKKTTDRALTQQKPAPQAKPQSDRNLPRTTVRPTPPIAVKKAAPPIAHSTVISAKSKLTADGAAGVRKPHATISFGDEDDVKRGGCSTLARSGTGLYAELSAKSAGRGGNTANNTEHGKKQNVQVPKQKPAPKSDPNAQLRRWLPTACDFLPEQARNDFSNGIHDFYQAKLQPKDYSGTLMLPYRGLEGFVVALQRAKGIKVKMIGQAFDKDDAGNYILKRCYTQRINSVIFDEVMVALYTEYFKMRNFIVHTDNAEGSASRSISDREVAKGIFDNILRVVEYNAKKLKEISFEMAQD